MATAPQGKTQPKNSSASADSAAFLKKFYDLMARDPQNITEALVPWIIDSQGNLPKGFEDIFEERYPTPGINTAPVWRGEGQLYREPYRWDPNAPRQPMPEHWVIELFDQLLNSQKQGLA